MENREVGFVVNDEYKAWIEDIKKRIKQSQIKAAVKVNYELLELYWGIGRDIVAKQKHAKWGDAFLATMSKDLQKSFPDMSGFSVQNLKSIRYWYKFYNSEENGLQPVSRMELIENMVKSIPWGHNQRIMYKCHNVQEALFYVQKTMDNGWSRNVLEHQIDLRLVRTNDLICLMKKWRLLQQKHMQKEIIRQGINFLDISMICGEKIFCQKI